MQLAFYFNFFLLEAINLGAFPFIKIYLLVDGTTIQEVTSSIICDVIFYNLWFLQVHKHSYQDSNGTKLDSHNKDIRKIALICIHLQNIWLWNICKTLNIGKESISPDSLKSLVHRIPRSLKPFLETKGSNSGYYITFVMLMLDL